MVPTLPVTATSAAGLRGALVMATPTMSRSSWLRRLGGGTRGILFRVDAVAWEKSAPRLRHGVCGVPIMRTGRPWSAPVSKAVRGAFWLMHGRTDRLAAHLVELGLDAPPWRRTASRPFLAGLFKFLAVGSRPLPYSRNMRFSRSGDLAASARPGGRNASGSEWRSRWRHGASAA